MANPSEAASRTEVDCKSDTAPSAEMTTTPEKMHSNKRVHYSRNFAASEDVKGTAAVIRVLGVISIG